MEHKLNSSRSSVARKIDDLMSIVRTLTAGAVTWPSLASFQLWRVRVVNPGGVILARSRSTAHLRGFRLLLNALDQDV